VIVVAMVVIWGYTFQTGGLIDKRYITKMQQDGQRKSVYRKRRYCKMKLILFFEYLFGAGVGVRNKKKKQTGILYHMTKSLNARLVLLEP
jgi:hypothetical protein